MVFACDKAQLHPEALPGHSGCGVCKWSHRKHKTLLLKHTGRQCSELQVVRRDFWCLLMGRPKLQETCIWL